MRDCFAAAHAHANMRMHMLAALCCQDSMATRPASRFTAVSLLLSAAAAVAPPAVHHTSPASPAVTVTPPMAASPCSALRALSVSSNTSPSLRAEPADRGRQEDCGVGGSARALH